MKRMSKGLFVLCSVLLLTLFSTSLVQAAELPVQKNVIQVNGKATIKVKPNIAYINANVTTENKDAKKAQVENAQAIEKIKKDITSKFNLKDDDISTIRYSVRPSYDYVEGKQIFRNYTVEHTLGISLHKISQAGEMVDALVASGATNVDNIRFGITDESEAYNQGLQQALQHAQQKANTLTTAMGVGKSAPIAITEQSESQGLMLQENTMAMSDSATSTGNTTIEQSDIEVVARLQVTFQW